MRTLRMARISRHTKLANWKR